MDEPITAKMTIGLRLKAERKSRGLTQNDIAERTGIHRPNIARIEAGKHVPELDTIERYVAGLGCHLDLVFTDKSP